MNIFEEINKKILCGDGAMGTMLHRMGLKEGVCPESFNKDFPDTVRKISELYRDAGSDFISTNTFGANSFKLSEYDCENMTEEYNILGAEIAKSVMGNKGFVFASCGTTGQILEEEGGFATAEEIYTSFARQTKAQALGGADGILIETQYSKYESSIAIKAAKDSTGLPVACTFAFEKGRRGFRTMMGLSITDAIQSAIEAGADIVGANCGNGIENMAEICKEIRQVTGRPILINSNAGVPALENGETVFRTAPEEIAKYVPDLINAGANIIGGCCGTTPEHIKAMYEVICNFNTKQ